MKVKMMQQDGSMALVVSGAVQDLVIKEEDGCFSVEWLAKAPEVVPQAAPVVVPEEESALPVAPVGVQEEAPPVVVAPVEEVTPRAVPEVMQDDGLFKKLSLLRRELANASKVAPYLVFHDKTLHEMAQKKPTTLQALGDISGVGTAKLDKYGPAFLAAINNTAA